MNCFAWKVKILSKIANFIIYRKKNGVSHENNQTKVSWILQSDKCLLGTSNQTKVSLAS
jgi:hypothetical protein